MCAIKIQEIQYKNFGKCVRLSNDEIELFVTLDRGPRIIKYAFIDEENVFCEHVPGGMKVFNGEWESIGGHRLWHSPELNPRTYVADNDPVKYTLRENGVIIEQETELWTNIKKTIKITINDKGSKVQVAHRLRNKNAWPIELAVWAISVMAPGGIQIVQQPSRETGLLPNRVLALWTYSKMNDSRVYFGEKYITLKQDSSKENPFKFGIPNEAGWAAYVNKGYLFIKRYNHEAKAEYPDFGVSYESYTNKYMLEMETLSLLIKLQPEGIADHIETWELRKNVSLQETDENSIDEVVKKEIHKYCTLDF